MVQDVEAHRFGGRETLALVGESFYSDNLKRLVGVLDPDDPGRIPIIALLVAEVDNSFDPNAVSAWISGLKVGHLSRDDAARYRPGLLELVGKHGPAIALEGVIVGQDGVYGVFLNHDPEDFGLPAKRRKADPTMRTGLSDVIVGDEMDDSYDMSWMDELPADPIGAVKTLRQLLVTDPDPIDRHFMFCQLEATLYRARDSFGSALDDYDDVCRQHDGEMESIRPALVTRLGKVPLLETYKQAAIRHQKAKNFDQALWWAERGIALYGDDAHAPTSSRTRKSGP